MLVSDIFRVFVFTTACVGFTLEMFVDMYGFLLVLSILSVSCVCCSSDSCAGA